LDRFSEELRTNFWWLNSRSSLSFTATAAKEKNNIEQDIPYSCKNKSGEESEQKPLAWNC